MLVVITGTSRGVGYNLACEYLKEGHRVLGCSRSTCNLESEKYTHVLADLADSLDVRRFVKKIKEIGEPDLIVLSAGAPVSVLNLALQPLEEIKYLSRNNFAGPLLLISSLARTFVNVKKHLSLVFISSMVASRHIRGSASYAAGKVGVEKALQVLAEELAVTNIRVNTIRLGIMEKGTASDNFGKDWAEEIYRQQFLKRPLTVTEVKGLLDFFVSKNGVVVSGQTIGLGVTG